MTTQELIEKINKIAIETPFPNSKIVDHLEVIKLIGQLDKPEKITIPQHIANWIVKCKAEGKSLLTALLYTPEKVNSWVDDPDNQEIFAIAWIFGYIVEKEKEKRYFVKVKGVYHGDLGFSDAFGGYSFYNKERNLSGIKYEHTRKELEGAGFGWVFDCEGIEIEEVTE